MTYSTEMLHRTPYAPYASFRWERSERALRWVSIIVAVVGGGSELTEHRYPTMVLCLAVAAGLYGLSWLVGWYSHR